MSDERREASEHAKDVIDAFSDACRARERFYSSDEQVRRRDAETRAEVASTRQALTEYIVSLEADRDLLDLLEENPDAVHPESAVNPAWNADGFHDETDGWADEENKRWYPTLREALRSFAGSPLAPTQEGE